MKNIFAILLGVVLISTQAHAQSTPSGNALPNPEPLQYALVINYTATWCPPCGKWGSELIHKWSERERVVPIKAHSANDPMYIPSMYAEMNTYRPVGRGIPSFWIGDSVSYKDETLDRLLSRTPKAGLSVASRIVADTMYVRVKVAFFEATQGSYYVSLLALEDKIDGSAKSGTFKQAGTQKVDFTHDFVVRASATGNFYGGSIPNQTFDAGASLETEVAIVLPAQVNKQNVYPVGILWKKENNQYLFVNAIK